MTTKSEINFINEKINYWLKDKARIKKWITKVILKEKQQLGAICYVLCSDEYLRGINKKYLKHNYYTDIITFDYSEKIVSKSGQNRISGDIFISVDRVRENARDLGMSFDNELKRVLIHGALHLLGYSDKTESEQEKMRKREDGYIKLFD